MKTIITLTSDRNQNDFFLARVKGQILRDCPESVVLDIAHNIDAFNLTETGFIIKHSFRHFPEGTIHLIGVDCEAYENHEHLIAKYQNHYFIAADNGVFGLIFDEQPEKIIKVDSENNSAQPALLRFVEITHKLIESNHNLEEMGVDLANYNRKFAASPVFEESMILGKVIYIDSYKNVMINILREDFERIGRGRSFKIFIGSNRNSLSRITQKYSDTEPGELAAIFNSLGLLEIAIVRGKLAEMLNFTYQTQIRINFYD